MVARRVTVLTTRPDPYFFGCDVLVLYRVRKRNTIPKLYCARSNGAVDRRLDMNVAHLVTGGWAAQRPLLSRRR